MDPKDIELGNTVTPQQALNLAEYYELTHIVERFEINPHFLSTNYKDFIFDGASCLIDSVTAFIVGINSDCFTYECAMPHDIAYYFGEPNNKKERKEADLIFKSNLIKKCHMNKYIANVFYLFVRLGGFKSNLSFAWSFGLKKRI